ncbi:MAG: efflux RND transporter periplasmic adaptor subunit [Planctomyces sp.]|nr:efflux RND transporter periplasmic adaptor subunit [Planctomyces sp.]
MQLSLEDLPVLLARAASRQGLDSARNVLLKEFVSEAFRASGSNGSLHLYEITSNSCRRLISSSESPSDSEALEAVQLIAPHIRSGHPIQSGSYATADVTPGVVLLAEFRGSYGGTAVQDGIAEICADLYRRQALAELRDLAEFRNQVDPLIAALYASEDSVSVANVLATDGVLLLKCSRISICERTATGGWYLLAATSVSTPNPRADAVRRICELVANAEQEKHADPPEFVKLTSPSGFQLVGPLSLDAKWSGSRFAAIFEWDQSQIPDVQIVNTVCRHAALAFRNTERTAHTGWFFVSGLRRVFRSLTAPGQWRVKLTMIGLTAVIGFLCFLPMQLTIDGNGVLEPSHRQYLWAADEGIVMDVLVNDGQEIENGAPVIRIRNDELSLQLETVQGDLATAQSRLAALESMRVGREASRDPVLLSEHSEVTAKITSLEEQNRLLERRIQDLTITSPMKGRLFGANLKERFQGRPVIRGQYFCEVADLTQPWEIRLQVREADVRHLLNAVQRDAKLPEVTFAMATQPDVFLTVRVTEISPTTKLDSYGNLTTEIVARLEEPPAGADRPGTGVLGRIQCGKRSAGYVCFRRMIDYVSRLLFM